MEIAHETSPAPLVPVKPELISPLGAELRRLGFRIDDQTIQRDLTLPLSDSLPRLTSNLQNQRPVAEFLKIYPAAQANPEQFWQENQDKILTDAIHQAYLVAQLVTEIPPVTGAPEEQQLSRLAIQIAQTTAREQLKLIIKKEGRLSTTLIAHPDLFNRQLDIVLGKRGIVRNSRPSLTTGQYALIPIMLLAQVPSPQLVSDPKPRPTTTPQSSSPTRESNSEAQLTVSISQNKLPSTPPHQPDTPVTENEESDRANEVNAVNAANANLELENQQQVAIAAELQARQQAIQQAEAEESAQEEAAPTRSSSPIRRAAIAAGIATGTAATAIGGGMWLFS